MKTSSEVQGNNLAEGRIPTANLFAYAAGIAGQNMHYSFINGWLFYFCNNVLKISAQAVGLITGISRLWDSVNDPLIGGLIDKHRFKKTGEKLLPYLYILPGFIGVLSLLMFKSWGFTGAPAVIYILICYLLWDVLYSMQDVALWGMLALSSPNYQERARASQWTAIGVTAGCAVAGLFPLIKDIAASSFGVSDKTIFFAASVVLGLGGQIISMSAGKMNEAVTEEKKEKQGILDAIFVLRHNKTLLLVSAARILDYVKLSVPWAYFFESQVFYKIGGIEIGGGTAQFIYGLIGGAPGTLAMFAATKIVAAIGGMKKTLIFAKVSAIAVRIVAYFIGFKTPLRMLLVILVMALQSIPEYMINIAHRSIMSDSIDEVEYKTGKRTEGITFSMQNFATKVGDALSLFINGQLLSLVKYDQNIPMTAQNPVFMKWQWPMFILGPIVGAILYLCVIVFVKDDEEHKKLIEYELKKRRSQMAEQAKAELNSI